MERLEGFGGFEAWQTAALNAYKKPLLRPEGALEPLLWPCGGFCVREWRVLGLLGYLVPAELCELLERLEGFGGFEAWQTAALNAYKKPLLRPEGALEPLLWPCGGFCVREWRVLGLLGYLVPAELCELLERLEGFGGFEAWQTAALNAYKKPLLRPEGALEPLLWPCGGFCVREWRVLGLLGYLVPAELCELLERLEGFGGFEAWQTAALNAYKKPLLRPEGALAFGGFWRVWLGLLGYLVPAELCELLERLEGFGAFGGFEAWQTAALNAYKKPLLRPEGALEPLLWPCGGFCVREWRVLGLLGYLVPAELCELLERLGGFGGFEAWQTAALNAYKKPLLRPEGALAFGGFWRVWLGLLGYLVPAELCELLERLEGFGAFGGFEAWQTAALNAYKKPLLRPEGALEGFGAVWRVVVAFACGSLERV